MSKTDSKAAHLTQEQFATADDAIAARLRATKSGTPERDAAFALSTEWEAANAKPAHTWQQRQDRFAAIAAVARKHSLI